MRDLSRTVSYLQSQAKPKQMEKSISDEMFTSNIAQSVNRSEQNFSTESQAEIVKLEKERKVLIDLMFKSQKNLLNFHDTAVLETILTADQINQLKHTNLISTQRKQDEGQIPSRTVCKTKLTEKNVSKLIKKVSQDSSSSNFRSKYASIANDKSFKPNLLKAASSFLFFFILLEL